MEIQYLPTPDVLCTPNLSSPTQNFFSPPSLSILLVSPLKAVFFTRVKLPQVVEVPVQPCIIATKDVQLPIVANWKERGMSRV